MDAGLPSCHQLNRYFRSKKSLENFDTFIRLVEEGDITESNFQEFFDDPERFFNIPPLSINVIYWNNIYEMITRGCYEVVNPNFNPENFNIFGMGRVQTNVRLVHIGFRSESAEILTEMRRKKLQPAKIEHLLAFGAKYPKKQCQFPVVALGTVWESSTGQRYVPFLSSTVDGKRSLCLGFESWNWEDNCRFLAY